MSKARLKSIARLCCDPATVDALDRIVRRGRITRIGLKRIASRCSDCDTTDALDELLSQ